MFQKRLGAVMPGSNTYLILRKHFRNIVRMNIIDRKTDYSVMIVRILTPQYTDMLCFTKRLHRLCRKSPVSLLNVFVSYAVYVLYCLRKCICSGSIYCTRLKLMRNFRICRTVQSYALYHFAACKKGRHIFKK